MSSVNLSRKSDLLKESESEHGDKTYLVRTDLAGQVIHSHIRRLKQFYIIIVQRLPRPMEQLQWRALLAA